MKRTPPQGTTYHVRPYEDEEDTNPGTPSATEARRRISGTAANDEEIRALEAIVKAWQRMDTEDRVLILALCRRLDPLP